MNAEAIRHLYGYHFSENRRLWDEYISQLDDEQFTAPVRYSVGSVRDQIVHIMSADKTWFCPLRGYEIPDWLDPADFPTRESIRVYWDVLEQFMWGYLADLQDDMLWTRPLEGEDESLFLWQVLLHVVNHATDHRAQILRALNDLGLSTTAQDYIFYAYDNP